MFMTLMYAAVLVCGTLASGAENAQDLKAMKDAFNAELNAMKEALNDDDNVMNDALNADYNAMNEAFNADLNAQIKSMMNDIVQTSMHDPHAQQMHQEYLSQGGQLNFEDDFIMYAETGGFSKEGDPLAAERSWGSQDKWAKVRGEILSGQSPFTNSSDGSKWQLPNTASPGDQFFDRTTGTQFWMDDQGQYWMNQGNGWSTMNYQSDAPRDQFIDRPTGTQFWMDAQGRYWRDAQGQCWMNLGNGWTFMNYQSDTPRAPE